MARFEGGCLCGAIRYVAEGPVLGSAACHCRDCQYVSGGAPAYVMVMPKASVRITRGTPKVFWNTAASGARRGRHYCPECGTPLFAENDAYPNAISIKVGSLDDSSSFRITAHFWTTSAPPWHSYDPSVPKLKRGAEQ